jgi:hypothetical protein
MDYVPPITCRQASILLFGCARPPGEVEDGLEVLWRSCGVS